MGPLRGSASFHPQGRTLFETLVLGMPYVALTGQDEAPWEAPLPDPLDPMPAPTGIATLVLGGFRHALLLEPSPGEEEVVRCWITWGAQDAREPVSDPWLMHYHAQGTEHVPLARAERAAWRSVPDLCDPQSQPPVWERLFADLEMLGSPPVGATMCGIDQERGKAQDRQLVHDRTGTLGEAAELVQRVRWVLAALAQGKWLERAVQELAQGMGIGKASRGPEVVAAYWDRGGRAWQARELVGVQRLSLQVWEEMVSPAVPPQPRFVRLAERARTSLLWVLAPPSRVRGGAGRGAR